MGCSLLFFFLLLPTMRQMRWWTSPQPSWLAAAAAEPSFSSPINHVETSSSRFLQSSNQQEDNSTGGLGAGSESGSSGGGGGSAVRTFELNVVRDLVPLGLTVPARLREDSKNAGGGRFRYNGNDHPGWLAVARVAGGGHGKNNNNTVVRDNGGGSVGSLLMAPPLHVQAGDTLRVKVTNGMHDSGLSVHWHGFEMQGRNMAYDGVVGLTQCAIPPASASPSSWAAAYEEDVSSVVDRVVDEEGNVIDPQQEDEGRSDGTNGDGGGGGNTFVYDFVVTEDPGTYWYHTHSGALDVTDAVRGPLVVHPPGAEARALVDALNRDRNQDHKDEEGEVIDGKEVFVAAAPPLDPLSYRDERILFLSDGFKDPEHSVLLAHMGGLSPALSKNADGFSVGTHPWEFGTVNGRVREVVTVEYGRRYRLRLVNAGTVYALRFYVPGMTLTVVEADSNPVEPYRCDEVILHAAERFSVEIEVPPAPTSGDKAKEEGAPSVTARSFWIRADTLESRELGYDNGIRAVLHAVPPGTDLESIDKDAVEDPPPDDDDDYDARHRHNRPADLTAVNCYSRAEGAGCVPLTALVAARDASEEENGAPSFLAAADPGASPSSSFELHTIDVDFSPPPQFAHFVRLDRGPWIQHVDPGRSMLLPDHGEREGDLHPNTAVLHVKSWVSDVILVWRNMNTMDHPIHLHGYKLEILDANIPVRQRDCTFVKCKPNVAFSSRAEVERLRSIPHGRRVVKDTFVVPAGGAVATRVRKGTGAPGVWLAHCHMNLHREDGMTFVLNVGNYTPSSAQTWLPPDYPECDTPFSMASRADHPACRCFDNQDALLGLRLKSSDRYRCSRAHLCHHAVGELSSLPYAKYPGGIRTHGAHRIAGWAISLLVVASVAITATGLIVCHRRRKRAKKTAALLGRTSHEEDNPFALDENVANDTDPGLDSTFRTKNRGAPAADVAVSDTQSSRQYTNGSELESDEHGRSEDEPEAVSRRVTVGTSDSTATEQSGLSISDVNTEDYHVKDAEQGDALHQEEKGQNGHERRTSLDSGVRVHRFAQQLHVVDEEDDLESSASPKEHDEEAGGADCLAGASTARLTQFKHQMRRSVSFRLSRQNSLSALPTTTMARPTMHQHRSLSASMLPTMRTKEDGTHREDAEERSLFTAVTRSYFNGLIGSEPHESNSVNGITGAAFRGPLILPQQSERHCPRRSLRSMDPFFSSRKLELDSLSDGEQSTEMKVEAENSSHTCADSFFLQVKVLFLSDWKASRPACINMLRVFEVVGLALLTGVAFYSVGSNTTNRGLRESISLLFFSMTLWTFNRMYPAVMSYNSWRQIVISDAINGKHSVGAACLSRTLVLLCAESWWPFIYCLICFPLAQIAGDMSAVLVTSVLLSLNLMCYISIGSLLGTVIGTVSWGMIAATLFSQTTIMCAGFYTTLPPFLSAFRYVSPVFYCFSGIVKVNYSWSDTFDCIRGDSELGANKCFLEFSGSIEDLKYRGINVATFNDPMSGMAWKEILCLIGLYVAGQVLVFGFLCLCAKLGSLDKGTGGESAAEEEIPMGKLKEKSVKYVRRLSDQ